MSSTIEQAHVQALADEARAVTRGRAPMGGNSDDSLIEALADTLVSVSAERDALAAVIEEALEAGKHTMHPDQTPGRCGVCRMSSILSRVPSDVLVERDARIRAEVIDWVEQNLAAAKALREFAKKVYNGAPATRAANFQAFYNDGLHPVLMAEADRIERGSDHDPS